MVFLYVCHTGTPDQKMLRKCSAKCCSDQKLFRSMVQISSKRRGFSNLFFSDQKLFRKIVYGSKIVPRNGSEPFFGSENVPENAPDSKHVSEYFCCKPLKFLKIAPRLRNILERQNQDFGILKFPPVGWGWVSVHPRGSGS